MNEWDIQPRGNTCGQCARPFAAQQVLHTLLTLGAEGYRRQDFCCSCWNSALRASAISHWQSVFEPPPPPPTEVVKKETAESLLRKLLGSDDPAHAPARYILAVMLERRRILKPRGTTEQDGRRALVYEHAQTGESFVIPDPRLRLEQLEEVQKQVVALLGGGENAGAAAPAPSAAAPESIS